jgi:hypothetical protein
MALACYQKIRYYPALLAQTAFTIALELADLTKQFFAKKAQQRTTEI